MVNLLTPNTEVRLKFDPSQAGFTTGRHRDGGGLGNIIEVKIAGKGKQWIPETQLEIIDNNAGSSEDIRNDRFSGPDTLRRLLIHIRLSGRLADMIYSMEATNTEFHAYQFKPVIKILNSPSGGILIADEVGLGKTIEAGLIWTELSARYDAKNLLVICPKSLTQKWQDELKNKFNIKSDILNAKQFKTFLKNPNERNQKNAIICSRDSIRPDKDWDTDEYNSKRSEQREIALMLDHLSDGEPIFDLLVVDEAHHIRNPSTQSHKLTQMLRSISDHCVFLSATPIHLKNRDLFAQLKLLDPGAFVDETDFEALIVANTPIVAAREAILHNADTEIAKELIDNALHNSLLEDSESLKKIYDELNQIIGSMTYEKRAELAARLDTINLLSNLVTRTRRRDVRELRVERRVKTLKTSMSDPEGNFYNLVETSVTRYANERDINQKFLLVTPHRMMTSCMPATLRHWRSQGEIQLEESQEDFADIDEKKEIGPLISHLYEETKSVDIEELIFCDEKYNDLKEFLSKDQHEEEKKVLFSSFRSTLEYLHERLSQDGFSVVIIHGGLKDRHEQLNIFKNENNVEILLSSEIGSEGLDLQFCKTIINYDLPWNPMKVEQRIGRVDRFGQKSDYVAVINFIYDQTIDQRIWDRLYDRLKLCEQALGGFEEILGDEIKMLEHDIIHGDLSNDEQNKRIEQTSIALENKRKMQEEIEDEAAGLIAHGDYILNKVQSAHEFNRWLTPNDMISYLKAVFKEYYPQSKILINTTPNEPNKLTLDTQLRDDLKRYINEYKLGGITIALLNQTETLVWFGKPERQLSASEDVITQHHPLMRFASNIVSNKKGTDFAPAISAKLSKIDQDKFSLKLGTYLIAIQQWSLSGLTQIEKLAYAGINYDTGLRLSSDEAEYLTSMILINAEKNSNMFDDNLLNQFAITVDELFENLQIQFHEFFNYNQIMASDRAKFQTRSLDRHFHQQKNTIYSVIDKHREIINFTNDEKVKTRRNSLIKAQEGKLKVLEEKVNSRMQKINRGVDIQSSQKDVSAIILQIN